jgi:hypothetical protein
MSTAGMATLFPLMEGNMPVQAPAAAKPDIDQINRDVRERALTESVTALGKRIMTLEGAYRQEAISRRDEIRQDATATPPAVPGGAVPVAKADTGEEKSQRGEEHFRELLNAMREMRDDVRGLGKRMDDLEKRRHDDDRKRKRRHDDDDAETEEEREAKAEEREEEEEREVEADDDKRDRRRKRDDGTRSDDDDRHHARDDGMRADSAIARERAKSDAEVDRLAELQTEWSRVGLAHGDRRSFQPMMGEGPNSYDRRFAKAYQRYSDKWGTADFNSLPASVIKIAAADVRADAMTAAYRPEAGADPVLREVKRIDRAGRTISEFVGPVNAINGMLAPFRLPVQRARIRTPAEIYAMEGRYLPTQ